MRWLVTFAALAVKVAVVAAQTGNNVLDPAMTKTNPEPCAVVSSHAVSYMAANPRATAAVFKPSEVYACLQSVPYDQSKDTRQVAWIQDLLQFQSTLAYLKNPPPGYPLPAVDLSGGLNNISTAIASGKYTNEYDIELDIYNLVHSANDEHLAYTPFLVGIFHYHHGISLVSVSLDGVAIPKIYVRSDLVGLSDASFTPSAVVSINGQDVGSITQFARGMQDLDAMFNSVFYNPVAVGTRNGSGSFEESLFTQHSDTTSCTFENGTTTVVSATAEIRAQDVKVIPADGQSFYRLLTAAGKNPSSPSVLPSPLPHLPNYPDPFVKSYQNYISGYFMNGTDNTDLAVLSVASFNLTGPIEKTEFLKVSSTFLAKCASTGKKRLIVDVRNNAGGNLYFGYALFQQLFPSVLPYSGFRMRGSDAANALGQIASKSPPSDDLTDLTNSVFNARALLRGPDGPSFDSWQQFYGPLKQYKDLFSNIGSWNFITSNYSSETAAFTSNTSIVPPQVFPSDAITLLTDGHCSSTCADFSNLMISQGRVKTVTVGGRPNNQPMAVIGGVQGALVLTLSDLQDSASQAIALQVHDTGNSSAKSYETRRLLQSLASPPPIAPESRPESVSVNFWDNIAQNDPSMTPLQFSGGIAADCRFYYMPADITNVTNTWARVAKGVKAGGDGLCINRTLTRLSTSTNSTTGTTNTPVASGSNGGAPPNFKAGAPSNFKGGATVVEAAKIRWIALLMTFGSVATMLL